MTTRGKQFIVELDDRRYRLRGTDLEPVATLAEVTGDKWVVSDFEGATPQVMTVSAPIKYVDAVIEKRLRESGAMIGGGRVLVLRKHRRGARATEVLFINVPSALYARYAAAAEDDASHQPLFALHSLLSRELENLRSDKPVALILVHDRHVDTVVGSAGRTHGAFRASWHRVGEDTVRLIANIADGLRRIEQENNVRIKELHCHYWLLERREDGEWAQELADELGIPRVRPAVHRLRHEGERYCSSVPGLLAKLSIADSVSTPVQKNLYRAQAVMPWAAAVLVMITIVALLATVYWDQRAHALVAESAAIQRSLSPPEPGPAVLRAAYEKPLKLADTLGRAQIAPSFRSVLAQVSASVSNRITFDEVVIEYPADEAKVMLTLVGQSAGLEEGQGVPAFNAFLAALRQRGYTLVNSELETESRAFSFLVELERGLN